MAAVDDDFANFTKVDSCPSGNVGLHLPHAPIGFAWVFYKHPRFKKFV